MKRIFTLSLIASAMLALTAMVVTAQEVGYVDVKVNGKTEKLRLAELSYMYCKNGVTIFVKSQEFEDGKEYSYTKPGLSYSLGEEGLGVGNELIPATGWDAYYADGNVFIRKNGPIGKVAIYSIMGALIADFNITGSETTFYMSLPPGVYILRNNQNSLKFVSK